MKFDYFIKSISIILTLLIFSCSLGLMKNREDNLNIKEHLQYLASDRLEGRYPGTEGDSLAAFYIRNQFRKIGLELLNEDGLQSFNVVTEYEIGYDNYLLINGIQKILNSDFIPLAYSKNDFLSTSAVFCGYGFDIEIHGQKIDNYSGVDCNGKWVILLRGSPMDNNENDPFSKISSDRYKVTIAKDHGASGVIFISEDNLFKLQSDGTKISSGIPVIKINRKTADNLLQFNNLNLEKLKLDIISNDSKFKPIELIAEIKANINIKKIEKTTFNIIAKLEGIDPIAKNESIVIGAHYDHLGMGGSGSGSRRPDQNQIHNGADDNASGVAALIHLAKKFKKHGNLKRSLIFVAFGAEEMGLLGSKKFIDSDLINQKFIQLMINMDMIGRLNENKKLAVGGIGTAIDFENSISSILNSSVIDYTFQAEGFGPSDHSSFYINDIPVLFFFTGAHQDYHTPEDDADKINYEGIKMITDVIASVIEFYSESDQKLIFKESGPKKSSMRSSFKVTLGIMPDYIYSEIGLRIDLVKAEGPASQAGIQKGDIIIGMNDKPVNDIYEYMHRLNEINPGSNVPVIINRGGEKISLMVQF